MAKNKSKTGLGSFFFKTKSKSEKKTDKAEQEQEEVIESTAEIAQLLIAVLEEKLPVRVFLGDYSLPYYSLFESEPVEDENGEIIENKNGEILYNKEHLERGGYILLAALDPPIGNIKIRTAAEINVELLTRFHLLECMVELQKITENKKLRLSFPQQINKKPQTRTAFRAPVDVNMDIFVTIIRPSGISFSAKLDNISVGGAAFYPLSVTARIPDNSRVKMDISYPEGNITVDNVVLGTFVKGGGQFFRSRFLVSSSRTVNDISSLVNYVQREKSKKRIKTFQ